MMPSLQFRVSKLCLTLKSKARISGYSTMSSESVIKDKTTVDNREVEQHTKNMHLWWDPDGPMKALHSFNKLRVPLVCEGLVDAPPDKRSSTPLMGKKILDIGCGGGILSMPLAKLGADVTGVDAGSELIEMARHHSRTHAPESAKRPTYVCSSIEEHAKENANFYDGVVASEIIEHIDNDKKDLFVKSCTHTLKPGGRIFFTTPTGTRISQLSNIWFAEYVLKAIPKGTHQYEKFTTPNELTMLLEKSGCKVEAVHGIFYNMIQNKWHWVNSTAFFFALQAVKID